MRTTTLTAASLLSLAMLAPTPVANAAGETCRGEAATIVGSPGDPALLGSDGITGTEGRDVVVTNGAVQVTTLGGDDVVCVTAGGSSSGKQVSIDAGAGSDIVDGTTAHDWFAAVDLGEGADRFEGGNAGNFVGRGYPNSSGSPDTEKDVILGGEGTDAVHSGDREHPNPDVIDLGGGDDTLSYQGVTAGGSIDGGPGVDYFLPTPPPDISSGDTVIDNAIGRLKIGRQVVATWSGMETFFIETTGGDDLTFVGTRADETVHAAVSGRVRATFGAGDDSFRAFQAPPRAGSVIDGGDGRDLFYVASESGLLDLDLRAGKLVVDATSRYVTSATDFEDASLFARRVILGGTGSGNVLLFGACDAKVHGRGGADTIARSNNNATSIRCPRSPKAHLSGGSGNDDIEGTFGHDLLLGGSGSDELGGQNGRDVLQGGPGNDRLFGGSGPDKLRGQAGNDRLYGDQDRDQADGGSGRKDLCRTERKRQCER